jgi:hypothetical protein
LILIDQGRGKEAITYLDEFDNVEGHSFFSDYRYQERDLEKAAALIDKKEYEGEKGAHNILDSFQKPEWNNTFTHRKAANYKLRLLIEFKKNKPKDFNESERNSEYKHFENDAIKLLKECVTRYDADNLKKLVQI